MPYRPEAELKRPDLKGEFLCGHCGKTFCHAASLNRHRLNFHGDDQKCVLCDTKIPVNETVRRHMQQNHGISRVFTCGCCNWTFPDKKELHSHNNSMLRNGEPGEARAIAISTRTPGSLSQHELKGEEKPKRVSKPKTPKKIPTMENNLLDTTSTLAQIWNLMANNNAMTDNQLSSLIPENWLQTLIINNPSLLPLFQPQLQIQEQTTLEANDEESCEDESSSPSSSSHVNNNEEKLMERQLELMVNIDSEPASGPESGVCSGEEATDSSPSPTERSKESSPASSFDLTRLGLHSPAQKNKRKSVDAIATLLYKKKCATN